MDTQVNNESFEKNINPIAQPVEDKKIGKIAIITGSIVLVITLIFGVIYLLTNSTNKLSTDNTGQFGNPPSGSPPSGGPGGNPNGNPGGSTISADYKSSSSGLTLSSGTEDKSDTTYSASNTDESAVIVNNGANLTLDNVIINKIGDSSSSDSSSFVGLNAGAIATANSTLSISNSTVNANGLGSNGVFATGTGSIVNLSNVKINAFGDGAHAVMATQGGVMNLSDVDMFTTDAHSGAIATDRGGGTITATGGTVKTTGTDSPGIYSTGNIKVSNADVTATNSEGAVIEGGNTITLVDTNLTTNVENKWGMMIYQSMSGDAEGTLGTISITGGSLTATGTSGALFYVNNSTGNINLSNVTVSEASGILLDASANSRWGTTGSNGGNAVLTANQQTLAGDITADNISTIILNLNNNSKLKGTINNANTAKSVKVNLDSTSSWIVTKSSYLTSISGVVISGGNISNITGNGNNVYYKSSDSANSTLGGKTYSLVNGGSLMPY